MAPANHCIYCPKPADSLEHPLAAAFGEFEGAPYLQDRICMECNNKLGLLDEQLSRCGPEAFLRRVYGVQGRSTHEEVNPFYRRSAGGDRLEMKAKDQNLGIEGLLECENGTYRQLRQLVFVQKSGETRHLPIREGTTPEQLRISVKDLGLAQPCDFYIFCDPEERAWVERLIKETSPQVTFGESIVGGTRYNGAVVTLGLTS